MKIDAHAFIRALTPIHAAIDPKASGAYSMIRMRCDEHHLFLLGGNVGTSIQTFIEVEDPDVKLDIATTEKDLFANAQHLEGEMVITMKRGRPRFQAGSISFSTTVSSTEYGIPPVTWDPEAPTLFVPSDTLRTALRQTLFCVGRICTSSIPAGLQMGMRDGELMLCGSDNFRLGAATIQIPHPFENFSTVVLPTKPVQILEREASRGQMFQLQLVKSSCTDSETTSITAFVGNMMVRTSLIAQPPADFMSLLDDAKTRNHIDVSIKRDVLARALRAVETAVTKTGNSAWFKFSEGNVTIQGSSLESGVTTAKIPCDFSGDVIDIGVEPKRIREAVERMSRETVTLEITQDPDAPISMHEDNIRYIMGTSYIDNMKFEEEE